MSREGLPLDTQKQAFELFQSGMKLYEVAEKVGATYRQIAYLSKRDRWFDKRDRDKRPLHIQAADMYAAGFGIDYIANELEVAKTQVSRWKNKGKWGDQRVELNQSRDSLVKSIARLSAKRRLTEAEARMLDKLTKSYERVLNAEAHLTRKQKPKRKDAKPDVLPSALREKVLSDDYGLYAHQKVFMLDESRFRSVIKSRQIGFSYLFGLEGLLEAAGGRDAVFFSASQDQADLIIGYAQHHAERLEIDLLSSGRNELMLPNGKKVLSRPANFRTAQGFTGSVWFDEFAWVQKAKRMWEAAAPIIVAAGGRITVGSTPYEKGNFFFRIQENIDNAFPRFSRHRVSIDDAIDAGFKVDLEEIRSLFDAEAFERLFRLRYFEDGESYFTFDEINACARDCLDPLTDATLHGGFDIGRTMDASKIVLVESDTWEDEDGKREAVIMRDRVSMQRASFETQKATAQKLLKTKRIHRLNVDCTGIGMNLAEDLAREFPGVVRQVHFTQQLKEELAVNMKRLFEERKIVIPNDPNLIAQILSIKRIAGEKGFKYDSDRNAEIGHADEFWALALACRELGAGSRRVIRVSVY